MLAMACLKVQISEYIKHLHFYTCYSKGAPFFSYQAKKSPWISAERYDHGSSIVSTDVN